MGIRAHHLVFLDDSELNNNQKSPFLGQARRTSQNQKLVNTFPVWLVDKSETPFRMTLYLKLHSPPANLKDYHLQAEVSKEKWAVLKDQFLPWQIHLDPLRLALFSL